MSDLPAAVLRVFFEEWGLYRKYYAHEFASLPNSIQLACGNCKDKTTWAHTRTLEITGTTSAMSFDCQLCRRESITFFINWQKGPDATASLHGSKPLATRYWTKVGQVPKPSIDVAPAVEKALGGSTELYKCAQICLAHGFGLGAVAYLRRIVEDHTNELIDVLAAQAESNGEAKERVNAIREAKNETVYQKKLQTASELLPDSLRPGGVNPLGQLHALCSSDLHDSTEEKCMKTAAAIREAFEYLFIQMRSQLEEKNKFAKSMQRLAGEM